MSDWRTMETAPKDGTAIILWCDFEDGKPEMTVARWIDNPAPAGPFGRFNWREMQDGYVAEQVPRFWHPLPNPPEVRAA